MSSSRQTPQKVSKRSSAVPAVPAPFAQAPSKLSPFLETLDKSKVYIVHLDRFPWKFKRQVFTVPVILNISIAVLLAWRLYAICPYYLSIAFQILGYETDAALEVQSRTTKQLIWISLRRGFSFFFDFLLFKFIGPWPISFFFELPGNPVDWRWNVGFQDIEIYVRMSRRWGKEDLMNGLAQGSDNPFFRARILPAIDKKWMQEKTGYLMMGKDFDLDFSSMVVATDLVRKKTLSYDDFQKSVFVHSDAHGWLSWEVHRLDEGSEDEARKKIVAFKDRLTIMGKEELFFRWIEIVQYESSQPGGFTQERQVAAMEKAKTLFEAQDIDFEEFLMSIGGIEGIPGFQQNGST